MYFPYERKEDSRRKFALCLTMLSVEMSSKLKWD